jgi:hypothetical protein
VDRILVTNSADRSLLIARLGDGEADRCARALLDPGLRVDEADTFAIVDGALSDRPDQGFRAVRAMRAMGCAIPAPLLVPTGAGLSRALEIAARAVSADPGLELAVLAENRDAASIFHQLPDSRAKALARDGLVDLSPLSAPEARAWASTHGIDAGAASASLERLVRDGVDDRLLAAFAAAASPREGSDADKARSAAESFLFQRFDSLAATASLFELNGRVELESGERSSWEIDLLARNLKLAVEIDGYHHFKDPEAYRRDRRKDLDLQRDGFLVLRFLAEDVVARLETILEVTLDVVAERRTAMERRSEATWTQR